MPPSNPVLSRWQRHGRRQAARSLSSCLRLLQVKQIIFYGTERVSCIAGQRDKKPCPVVACLTPCIYTPCRLALGLDTAPLYACVFLVSPLTALFLRCLWSVSMRAQSRVWRDFAVVTRGWSGFLYCTALFRGVFPRVRCIQYSSAGWNNIFIQLT